MVGLQAKFHTREEQPLVTDIIQGASTDHTIIMSHLEAVADTLATLTQRIERLERIERSRLEGYRAS